MQWNKNIRITIGIEKTSGCPWPLATLVHVLETFKTRHPCCPPPAGPPRPVLHRALPSPTPQNTPQGTGTNGITPER